MDLCPLSPKFETPNPDVLRRVFLRKDTPNQEWLSLSAMSEFKSKPDISHGPAWVTIFVFKNGKMMGMGGYNYQMKPLWSSWKKEMQQMENIHVPPSHRL